MGFQKGYAIICTSGAPKDTAKRDLRGSCHGAYAKPWDVLVDKPVDSPVETYFRPMSMSSFSEPLIVWANLMPVGRLSPFESHIDLPGVPAFLRDNINRATMTGTRLPRVNVSQEHGAWYNRRDLHCHPTVDKVRLRKIYPHDSIQNGDLLCREKLNLHL